MLEFATAPANIWQLIADTNRLNHFSGNPPLRVSPLSADSAARFRIQTRAGEIIAPFSLMDGIAPDILVPLVATDCFVPELKGVSEPPKVVRLKAS